MTRDHLREAVVPAYLFLCLVLGGSAQGVWFNAALQLLAIVIIAWALIAPTQRQASASTKWLLPIFVLALSLAALHLVPLPPALWTSFPGREVVVTGFAILGEPLPWLPISLAPYETLATALRLLPQLAILAGMLRLDAYRPSWLVWSLLAGTTAGVVLGALQVTGGGGPGSIWYLYPISNFDRATGFFANSNHMASLLVATIPFLFAILAASGTYRGSKAVQKRSALFALAGGTLLVILLGLALNGSLAGIGLGAPVVAASALLIMRPEMQRRWLLAPAVLLLVGVGAILAASDKSQSQDASISIGTRQVITETSLEATRDFLPLGSGVGSFDEVYRLYEQPDAVSRTFVNHAHNDYLEIALETGVPGVVLVLLFLAWWTWSSLARWRESPGDPYAKAATIASAAILAHSVVDFPLRTSAMAAVFAIAIALVAQSKIRARARDESDLWPTRHIEIR